MASTAAQSYATCCNGNTAEANARVKRIVPGGNPGITELVLREL